MASIITAINSLFDIYELIIVIWCILSWIPRRQGGWLDDTAQVMNNLVQPYLNIFRRFIPPMGGIDWSPMIAILALGIIQNVVIRLLIML
jgi:YggT family protein